MTWRPTLLVAFLGCAGATPQPMTIDTAHDACAHCRMIVSDPRAAAQIVAPGDEPLIFDDIGCLRDYLAGHPAHPDAVVYVADHRTGAWHRAEDAVYTRSATYRTPMGSGILAHADGASRDRDGAAAGGTDVTVRDVLGREASGARR
jgi:copper chaperone NosL